MLNSEDINRLISELDMETETLTILEEKNRKAQKRIEEGARDELDWAALGYTIHNIYNAIENYCLRIAKFFENGLSGDYWHKDLIYRMSLEIKDVRPALFNRKTANLIQELRAFRHVFRNIYQAELDPEKVSLVQKRLKNTLQHFYSAHTKFRNSLTEISSKLTESQ